jgi:SAM-dependent methyltransferase
MIKNIYKKLVTEKKRNNVRRFILKLAYPFFLGDTYYCNCCEKSFRKFYSKGYIRRPNAQCPYCGSLERVRLLDLYLTHELNLYNTSNIRVLHFAPENVLFKKLSSLDIEYVDADINPANARFIVDITNIGYQNDYFDLIICSHVLGHVRDEPGAIQELHRVLKRNGTALIMTLLNQNRETTFEDPEITLPEDRLKYYGEPDLCRLHGLDFQDRLARQGFVVELIDYREKLPAVTLDRNCLGDGDREMIFKCRKQ